MSLIAGSWAQSAPFLEPPLGTLPVPIHRSTLELGECLGMCESTSPTDVTCGVQCLRSVDVSKRGLPVYVPFGAQQLPPQYTGWNVTAHECSSASQSGSFVPNPNSPTIMEMAEQNP